MQLNEEEEEENEEDEKKKNEEEEEVNVRCQESNTFLQIFHRLWTSTLAKWWEPPGKGWGG